jgi:hypothetical protein
VRAARSQGGKFAALADAMFRVLTGVRDQVDKLDG